MDAYCVPCQRALCAHPQVPYVGDTRPPHFKGTGMGVRAPVAQFTVLGFSVCRDCVTDDEVLARTMAVLEGLLDHGT
jgi:hypothetical protein